MEKPTPADLLKYGKKNKTFLLDVKEADNDNPPTIFSDKISELFFSATYYGWLVGRYGQNWAHYVKSI